MGILTALRGLDDMQESLARQNGQLHCPNMLDGFEGGIGQVTARRHVSSVSPQA